MRRNLASFQPYQVFLNYPFQEDFEPFENAMHFAVIAAGLIPVCAKDLSTPDLPRLEMLVEAIVNCKYSAHDISKAHGEGVNNFARFNMPIEVGMAMFHALTTRRQRHRCAVLVPTAHDYKAYASDLAGLDARIYGGREISMLSAVYDWLRQVVPQMQLNLKATTDIQKRYRHFNESLQKLQGSGENGKPMFEEKRELMYQICSEDNWWDWRANRAGEEEFQEIPLAWKNL